MEVKGCTNFDRFLNTLFLGRVLHDHLIVLVAILDALRLEQVVDLLVACMNCGSNI
jgi:hypothetical protein